MSRTPVRSLVVVDDGQDVSGKDLAPVLRKLMKACLESFLDCAPLSHLVEMQAGLTGRLGDLQNASYRRTRLAITRECQRYLRASLKHPGVIPFFWRHCAQGVRFWSVVEAASPPPALKRVKQIL
jgi:hypothetical protein